MHEKILAYHIDLKHPMWTAAYLEQTASLLGEWGYNAVVLEVEDKLQFSSAPEIADADAFSPAEAAELAAMVSLFRSSSSWTITESRGFVCT